MSKVRAVNGGSADKLLTNGHVVANSAGQSKKNGDHSSDQASQPQDVQISYSSFAILALVFLGSLAFLYGIYLTFPDLEE